MFSDKENVVIDASEFSITGLNMRITVSVISDGPVICTGQFDGNVERESLHILPGGKLIGDIMANHVIISVDDRYRQGRARADGTACRF